MPQRVPNKTVTSAIGATKLTQTVSARERRKLGKMLINLTVLQVN